MDMQKRKSSLLGLELVFFYFLFWNSLVVKPWGLGQSPIICFLHTLALLYISVGLFVMQGSEFFMTNYNQLNISQRETIQILFNKGKSFT